MRDNYEPIADKDGGLSGLIKIALQKIYTTAKEWTPFVKSLVGIMKDGIQTFSKKLQKIKKILYETPEFKILKSSGVPW